MLGHRQLLNVIECLLYFHTINASIDTYVVKVNEREREYKDGYPSCDNRCGELQPKVDQRQCSCAETCFAYRNCCEDIAIKCPLVVNRGLKRFGHMLDLNVVCLEMADVLAIASCPQEKNFTKHLINTNDISEIMINTPVTDSITGLVYANIDIFNCNVPNTSLRSNNWTIGFRFNNFLPDKAMSKFEYYFFHSPFYFNLGLTKYPCLFSRIEFCHMSDKSRFNCKYRTSWFRIHSLDCKLPLCRLCRINIRSVCVDGPENTDGSASLSDDLELIPLDKIDLPWTKAQCRLSKNVTLSQLLCRWVNCSTHLGFYLYQDGSCRRMTFFFIAFPGEGWRLDETESREIVDYIMYYVLTFLTIHVLRVEPMRTLYNQHLNLNFSALTFILDFNSSVSEDILYLTHGRKLSILSGDVRAMVDRKLNGNHQDVSDLSMVWKQRMQKLRSSPNKTYFKKSSFTAIDWCNSSYFHDEGNNLMTLSDVNFTGENTLFCFCVSFHIRRVRTEDCQHKPNCQFKCYDQISLSLSGNQTVRNVLASSPALIQFQLFVLSVIMIFV